MVLTNSLRKVFQVIEVKYDLMVWQRQSRFRFFYLGVFALVTLKVTLLFHQMSRVVGISSTFELDRIRSVPLQNAKTNQRLKLVLHCIFSDLSWHEWPRWDYKQGLYTAKAISRILHTVESEHNLIRYGMRKCTDCNLLCGSIPIKCGFLNHLTCVAKRRAPLKLSM